MPRQMAGSRSIPNSLCSRTITVFIRFGSKVAIRPQIRSVIREPSVAVAGAAWAGRLSRHQSRDGLALCRGSRIAGATTVCDLDGTPTHCCRPRHFSGSGRRPCRGVSRKHSPSGAQLVRRSRAHWLWDSSSCSRAAFPMGGHAGWVWRSDTLVVFNGLCARRGSDDTARVPGLSPNDDERGVCVAWRPCQARRRSRPPEFSLACYNCRCRPHSGTPVHRRSCCDDRL